MRKGNQTPSQSVVLPYTATLGAEAVDIYNKTRRTAQEWQEAMIYDILAVNDEGLWVHTKFGYSLPRRNGKSEILAMRELRGLVYGERMLHTAHRTSTSHGAWELVCMLLEEAGYVNGQDYKTLKQFGLEQIEMPATGGRLNFRTRSAKGGLGEGYDLLIIDEAQEYTDDQESALKYVVTSSMNPQTLFCGTPPTPISSGTVFTKYRRNVLAGEAQNSGWAEWSIEKQSDPKDVELWYQTNPSLGTIFTERSVRDEIGTDDVDFNIQRLGLWIKYNQKSAISKNEWEALVEKHPKVSGDVYMGIKFGQDGKNVAASVAVKTVDGRIFVESLDCQSMQNGHAWLVDLARTVAPCRIAIDGANGQKILEKELKDAKVKGMVLPTVKEVIVAFSLFEQGIFQQSLCHGDQPSVTQIVSNCEKRAIGSNGGFGYRSIKDGAEVALLDSIVLAHWLCHEQKSRKKQQISY